MCLLELVLWFNLGDSNLTNWYHVWNGFQEKNKYCATDYSGGVIISFLEVYCMEHHTTLEKWTSCMHQSFLLIKRFDS